LKLRTGILISLVVLVLAVVAGTVFYATADHNTADVVIKTNGTNVTIQSSSFLFNSVPDAMLQEMKNKALVDVEDADSSVASIKADMQNIATKYNYTIKTTIKSQFGEDQLPMPATVKGTSMVPTLKDGQSIVVLKTSNFKVGDLVVAHHPEYNLIVKRVGAINGTQVYLESDNHNVEVTNEIQYVNGVKQEVRVTKTPLSTWLPTSNVIGVVKVY
jgi:signal peptidase I